MSSVQSTVCSRYTAPVRSSVCLSVQEIGFGDFVQIAVHVLSFACGNAPAAATTHRYKKKKKKTDARLFCFCPPDHPTLSPSISPPASSCRFLPRRVIVSRKDRCGTDRATGNKTAPSTLLEKLPYTSIARISSMYFTLSRRVFCSRRWVRCPLPSVPSVSRSSAICEVTLRACLQPRGISLRSWFQGWISVPLERTRTKEDRTRVLEAIEGHFAPPKPLRFSTALRPLRTAICGVKFWVYKEHALNFKPVALKINRCKICEKFLWDKINSLLKIWLFTEIR